MKFKSKLGIAALEELVEEKENTEQEVTEQAEDEQVKDEQTTDTPTEGTVDETATGDAPEEAAATTEPTESTDEEGTAVTVTDGGSEDGEAGKADDAAAQAESTGEPDAVVEDDGEDADSEVVEEELNEIDQLENKAADVSEDVEKLEVATESLEGCIAILDAAAQRGGLDIYGASLLRNNINTITTSLKVKPLLLPALEDLDTPPARIDGANVAKDQIVGFVRRIIEAIKSAFVRLGEWVVETYKRLTNAFVAIERRAQKLKDRIESSKMKEGKLDNKGLAAKLSIEGKLVEDLPSFMTKLGDCAKYLNDPKSYTLYLEALDKCEELIKAPEKDEEIRGEISAILSKWAEAMSKHAVDYTASVRAAAELDPTLKHSALDSVGTFSAPLLNNQHLVVTLPGTAEYIRVMEAVIATSHNTTTVSEVDALSQSDASKICDVVIDIAKQVRESSENNRGGVKDLLNEIKKRKDTVVSLSNVAADQYLKDVGAGEKMRKVIVFINSMFISSPKLPVHAINRALPRNLIIALDYVAASIGGAASEAKA